MSNLDLSKLNSEQELALREAYRYIRQRAAWLRVKKKAVIENSDPNTEALKNHQKQD